MCDQLVIVRDSYTSEGTFGKMFIDGEMFCHSLEKVDKDNKKGISCIPTGKYKLQLRYSPVIKRTTAGEYTEGYEVVDVPGRTYIMLHPANLESELAGCIACGDSRGSLYSKKAILNSRDTFRRLMQRLDEHSEWEVIISNLEYRDG